MKFTLSDSTIGLIEELGISQQDIAREIKRLYEQGNVSREISQQSISRYLKGGKFTEKDTEGIIMSALRSFVGVLDLLNIGNYMSIGWSKSNRNRRKRKTM